MQFSIEVLPAPFGPMMARISHLRMSNDTSVSAFTPPKPSDTFSTASSTSPLARSEPSGALMAQSPPLSTRGRESRGGGAQTWTPSRRLLQRRRLNRIKLHIPDIHPRRDDALAAVLECDLGGDVGLARSIVERLDQRGVALGDEAASHFLRTGQFAVVSVQFLVQNEEALDLRPAHAGLRRHRAVHGIHVPGDHVVDERVSGEFLVGGVGDAVALGPVADRHKVDVDEAGGVVALVAEGDSLLDVRIELQLILDVLWREQRTVAQSARVLGAVDDVKVAFCVQDAGVPRAHEAISGLALPRFLRIFEVADEHAGRA